MAHATYSLQRRLFSTNDTVAVSYQEALYKGHCWSLQAIQLKRPLGPAARGGGGLRPAARCSVRAVLLKAVKGRGNSGASEEGFFSSPAFRLSRIAFIVH